MGGSKNRRRSRVYRLQTIYDELKDYETLPFDAVGL